MNVQVAARRDVAAGQKSRLAVADGDIHPALPSLAHIKRFLSKRWADHLDTYGLLPRHGFLSGPAYPKGQPDAMRRDAYPPGGGRPGSDLDFMREQHLDCNNVELGILNAIGPAVGAAQNMDFGAALARATNEWQVEAWTSRDKRLRASVAIPYEDAAASVAEIEHWAGHPDFAQVLFLSRTAEPLGQRRYWPIFEAAARAGLPIGIHAFGYGGYPVSGGGWPSYYIEEMVGHAQASQSVLTSLIVEGVFARIPTLKVVMIEAGFAWAPSLAWRLDKIWKTLRSETPHLTRAPSEYMREQIWFTTQPMEEPEQGRDLSEMIDWIGHDRLLFATDYPHWDFDDPATALPVRLNEALAQKIFRDNARALYGA
jgi:predicted TIM-barrel fold metal-dependent hydrolase